MLPEIWSGKDKIPLSFWAIFCPFTPLLTPNIKTWKKCKKIPGDTLFDVCTINGDHMTYGS